jgi:hypothetical protein
MSETEEGHPLLHVIAAVLKDGPGDMPIIDAEGIDYVRKALDEYLDQGAELMGAVDCVLTASHLLEVEKQAEAAAVALVELVDRKIVIDALVAINEENEAKRAQAVQERADKFQQFSAGPVTKVAPAPDKKKKDGVKLDTFHFPKRL